VWALLYCSHKTSWRRAYKVTLCDKVRSSEIPKVLIVEPLLEIDGPSYYGLVTWPSHQTGLARPFLLAALLGKQPRGQPRLDGMITSPIWLGHVVVWSQQNYQRLLKTMRYFDTSCSCCPCEHHKKSWHEK